MRTSRDFVGYADRPPGFEWPNGGRLALNVVINYEEGAERNRLDGDDEVEPGETFFGATGHERDLAAESAFEYGSRVGIWRVMDVLDEFEIPVTVFACGLALERNPRVAAAFVERGYDIVGHGYRWIPHLGMTEDQEREQIRKAKRSIKQLTGRTIDGWFTRPPETVATRAILAEEGFLFDCGASNDELPYFDKVRGRPFLVLPYRNDINDVRWHSTARNFARQAIDGFDVRYREGRRWPRMMQLGIHARIIGRPSRILALRWFLDHVQTRRDVWITARTSIARFWAERFAPTDLWNWPAP